MNICRFSNFIPHLSTYRWNDLKRVFSKERHQIFDLAWNDDQAKKHQIFDLTWNDDQAKKGYICKFTSLQIHLHKLWKQKNDLLHKLQQYLCRTYCLEFLVKPNWNQWLITCGLTSWIIWRSIFIFSWVLMSHFFNFR